MADLTITAASVARVVAGGLTQTGTAGATITAGQTLYLDAGTNTLKLCHASTSAATAACVGIALDGAASGQPVTYQTAGNITIGATIVIGATYYTSVNNAGGITADVPTTGNYSIVLGIGQTAAILSIINQGANPLTAHA